MQQNTYAFITLNFFIFPIPILIYFIDAEDKKRAKLRLRNSLLGKHQVILFIF